MTVGLKQADTSGFTPRTLDARAQLANASKPLASWAMGKLDVEALKGRDTLWIVVRRPGKGGFAIKTSRDPGIPDIQGKTTDTGGDWRISTASGVFHVQLRIASDTLLRVTTSLTPSTDLLVPFWSRDLYPINGAGDPTRVEGRVEAAQRGYNTGLCYLCIDKPAFGTVLYVQNFTALNPYFLATGTKPDGVVGGEWPELGYQPPTAPLGNSPPTQPLRSRETVVISDALIAVRDACGADETESAVRFVEMLSEIYPHLDKPDPQYRDWIQRSQRTLRDLSKSPQSLLHHYGHAYVHPYVEAEYPDSMVQMTVLASLREFEHSFGKSFPLADKLQAGMGRFFDAELGCVRRYLPNVGDDKNADAVDSWYLYHPLVNLARLALAHDARAHKLLIDSIGYAIKAAHHFKYKWPIQYDVRTFKVLVASRNADGLGQTDVGGLYAYLMMQMHELTDEPSYLEEAKAALRALEGIRFELVYQTNLTAWGAVACVRLWRATGNEAYLDQANVFIAGFLHNTELWDSQIDHAKHYPNFFGATCLHDSPYMSAYECFECFAAFDELLKIGGADLPDALRSLVREYRRYTLDRAWYFYPDALPPDAIAKDNIRNGHIDRRLSFPLEDVYGDGQPAGQVGQEIYGCGGAFVFASRAMHEARGAPFRILTEHPATVDVTRRGQVTIRPVLADGLGAVTLFRKTRRLPRIMAREEASGDAVPASTTNKSNKSYNPPPASALIIRWVVNRRG